MFNSDEMKTFLQLNGVRPVRTTPYHPANNSRAQQMVRKVKEAPKKPTGKDTQCKILQFLWKQHLTPHSVTGKRPAELTMGRRQRSVLDKLHPDRLRELVVPLPLVKGYAPW